MVPDAISRRPNFLGKKPANQAWIASASREVHLAAQDVSETLDKDLDWESALIAYAAAGSSEGLDDAQREILKGITDLD